MANRTKCRLRLRLGLLALVLSGLAACGPEAIDDTMLSDDTPGARLSLRARVRHNGYRITAVRAVTQDATYSLALTEEGDGGSSWSATIDTPCKLNILYHFEVVFRPELVLPGTGSGIRTSRLPETGWKSISFPGPSRTGCTTLNGRRIRVDTVEDLAAPNCAVKGSCSLRGAIMDANTSPGRDVIDVPSGTYLLTRGGREAWDELDAAVDDLDITESVSLEGDRYGESPVIDARGASRIFQVSASSQPFVGISRMTLTGGHEEDAPGGAILNAGTLRVEQVNFHDNELSFGSLACNNDPSTPVCSKGGAVHNTGKLFVERASFERNTAGSNGWAGAIFNFGSSAETTIKHSSFFDNLAFYGGALANYQGSLLVENSTFHDDFFDEMLRAGSAVISYGTTTLKNVTISSGEDANALVNGRHRNDAGEWVPYQFVLGNSVVAQRASSPKLCEGTFLSLGGNWFGTSSLDGGYVLPCTLSALWSNPEHRDRIESIQFDPPLELSGGKVLPIKGAPRGPSPIDLGNGLLPCPYYDQPRYGHRPKDGDRDGVAKCDPGAYER